MTDVIKELNNIINSFDASITSIAELINNTQKLLLDAKQTFAEQAQIKNTEKPIEKPTEKPEVSEKNKFDKMLLSDEHDKLMQRRIDLHKKRDKEFPPKEETTWPKAEPITPLSCLTKNQRNELLKKIYNDAKKNIVFMKDENSTDVEKIYKEADRLLEVWASSQKKSTFKNL
jgi:hypothetical protein